MRLVYPVCCGVDVHKTFLVATIITTTNSILPKYQQKRFSTYYSGLLDFKQWLFANNCKDVCMESTGKYWVPVWNVLEAASINVVIANPKWVSAVKSIRMTRRIPSGSATCSVWGWFLQATSLSGISVSSESLPAFGVSSCPCVPVKRIAFKTLSLCAT